MRTLRGSGTSAVGKCLLGGIALSCVLLVACGNSSVAAHRGPVSPPLGATLPPVADDPTGGTNTAYCDRAARPEYGAAESSRQALSERTWEIELVSKAMQRSERIAVTLPSNYDDSGRTRYPVLYLLAGSGQGHLGWWEQGVENVIGDRQLIVVTPSQVRSSYSDWYGSFTGSGEPAPHWESFHIREVIPFVEANFPVRTDPAGRTIAGMSSGGHGAMKYAAAHPGLFGSAGTFSGAVNTTYSILPGAYSYPVIDTALSATTVIPTQGPNLYCTFGNPIVQEAYWKDNDPTYLAENLKGISLWLSTGDGTPGPYDAVPIPDPVELQVYYMTLNFAAQLDRYALPWTNDIYGQGTHTFPYWLRSLDLFLSWAEPILRGDVAAPEKFSYRSARPMFSAWDWHFAIHRDVQEFVYLQDVQASGFVATGSGTLDVLTAPLFRPEAAYDVRIDDVIERVSADAQGRLLFSVDLGPAHTENQRDFSDEATTGWAQRRVHVSPAI